MKFTNFFLRFLSSAGGVFLLGGIIGTLFFAAQFGLSVVNPSETDWIYTSPTHDTAQHFIGWEFYRSGLSDGSAHDAVIHDLAYPVGLPLTFMDTIPLFAIPLGWIQNILPDNFQYFGIWALICYILQGGIAAILLRKIWRKVFAEKNSIKKNQNLSQITKNKNSANSISNSSDKINKTEEKYSLKSSNNSAQNIWQSLFISAGTLIFVVAPMMIARTLYHPALAAQWLILLAILLIWNAPKFTKIWQFVAIWSILLVGAVLIHPYFLPMLGAMMLIASFRNITNFTLKNNLKLFAKIILPVIFAAIIFYLIGGFALGSGAEIHDLEDKGFNLLSFMLGGNYSILPSIPARSYSPETMMWLGLGMWIMLIFVAIYSYKNYCKLAKNLHDKYLKNKKISSKFFKDFNLSYNEKKANKMQKFLREKRYFRAGFLFRKLQWKEKFDEHFARNLAMIFVAICLLTFSVGVRVDFGPISLFQYSVPDKIYQIWSAFRAAAREAWPFYYALIFVIIYLFAKNIKNELEDEKKSEKVREKFQSLKLVMRKNIAATIAISLAVISLVQFCDIWFSSRANERREGFAEIQNTKQREFVAPKIDDLIKTQRNLIMLDANFRGDQSGFYELAQTALENNLTLNIGFFARVPEEIWKLQSEWNEKILTKKIEKEDFKNNIFVTRDENFAEKIKSNYRVEKRGGFLFIY